MGGFISRNGKIDGEIQPQLTQVKLEQILKLKEKIEREYPDIFLFTIHQASILFQEIPINIEKLCKILENNESMVDIMELYAIFYTFAKAQFNDKVKAVFNLFDYDCSGQIEFPELCSTLQSFIMALCKITSSKLPKETEIQHLAVKAFTYLDPDGSGTIDFNEFEDWITTDEDIQDILLIYLHYLTRNKALDLHIKYYNEAMSIFGIAANLGNDPKKIPNEAVVEKSRLSDYFKQLFKISADEKILFDLMAQKKDVISYTRYQDVMRAYISYLVVDINQDHILEPNEIKVLLWLVEGIEPNEERVKREMALMDKSKSGNVCLADWIAYVCSIDPVTGNTYFDYELKRKFDVYDTDSSGTIEKDELKLLLLDMVSDMYGEADKAKKAEFDDIMNVMVVQIAKAMDDNGDSVISWDEFKKHFAKISKTLEKLKCFICSK